MLKTTQESICHSQENEKLKENVAEETQALHSLSEDFKSIFINMLKQLKETTHTELQDTRRTGSQMRMSVKR